MKLAKLLPIVPFILLGFFANAQTSKTVDVYFYEQPLIFFKSDKSAEYAGVEADILKEFFKWCAEKKNINITPKYHGYKTFNEFYMAMQSAPANSIGAGTVTINGERKNLFDFSAPYLKNVAVFVSHGSAPTFSVPQNKAEGSRNSSGSAPDFAQLGYVALAEKGSTHVVYMQNFISRYYPTMKVEAISGNLAEILASDPKYVAYMDVITYRQLLKNSDKYFKIHRELTVRGENFGFILPKNSDLTPLINEFMESGFGFTATRKYQNILETYLGYELITTVDML